MMGGGISLVSTPGKGSLFIVDLPLTEARESDIVKTKQAELSQVIGLAPDQPEYRILIVEDQFENQLLLKRLMESVGFGVQIAENGVQGVELFQSWHPHFIWMDRRMPVMDGMEATRKIRELPNGKEVKIAAVTASAFSNQRKELLAAGMDDYVRKPYRAEEIYHCLTKQLGVKFLYKSAPDGQKLDMNLTPEMLAGLPEKMLDELRQALESLDAERIETAIQRIATQNQTLQQKLSYLVANYNYPAILRALQEIGPSN
jgi:CheY-like chemotaxis protein